MLPQARTDKLLQYELGDEFVVYDRGDARAHRLNPTAAWVWRHCDGHTSVATMAALLKRDRDLPADEPLIWLALEELQQARLLKGPLAQPTGAPRVSRREVVRRLGMAGALLLPVVSSITAPTPAMAQYALGCVVCPGIACTGQSCSVGLQSGTCRLRFIGSRQVCCCEV